MDRRKPPRTAPPRRNRSAGDGTPQLRAYPADSPQAAARILALALLADGTIHLAELSALARRATLQRLGIGDAAFNAVIDELCTDLLLDAAPTPSGHLVLGRDALRRILGDIGDPALQRRVLRSVLDIVHADGELAGGEAALLSVAAECWEIDPFDSYRILADAGHCPLPRLRRARRDRQQP